jgi:hypothetical protein
MSKPARWVVGGLWATAVAAAALPVWAQGEGEAAAEEEGGMAPGSEDAALTEEQPPAAESESGEAKEAAQETAIEAAPPPNETSPLEEPGETYHFVGLRYRGIIIPKFMMNLFGDGGRTVYVHAVGPEFTVRKDAFEYVFSAWYAAYSMDKTPFKASSDEENAWEIVESNLKILYLTTDFLWSSELSPELNVNYGMGAGFGFVFGDLHRVQAYPEGGVPGDPYDYKECAAEGIPDAEYCGSDNDHYGDYTEPSWANGGSKPIIFPWLALQTGLRYKPHKNFAARLDVGFGLSGFFFGLAGNYGL